MAGIRHAGGPGLAFNRLSCWLVLQTTMKCVTLKAGLGLMLAAATGAQSARAVTRFFAFDDPALSTFAYDTDHHGTVIGYCFGHGLGARGFVRAPGGACAELVFPEPGTTDTYPKAINDGGQIVGNAVVRGRNVAWLQDRASGRFRTLSMPGASETVVEDLAEDGSIVGWGRFTDPVYGEVTRGFLLRDGAFTSVVHPRGILTVLHGVDAAGDLLGEYFDVFRTPHAFLRLPDGRYATPPAPGPLRALQIDGLVQPEAWSVKDRLIVGFGRSGATTMQGWVMQLAR